MPILNRAAEMHVEITAWRRDMHMRPELLFDVHETAAFVTSKLHSFGCDEVATGIGRTGVVGVIRGRHGGGGTIGLRADMDALPITEQTGLPYASKIPGKMHACGHDGHTAMLLGAARYLCETRNFKGSVAVIFQPAEEGGGGGLEMVKDGMMEHFGIERIFGMHNMPGIPVGEFAIRPGPIMAAADEFSITVQGHGGHAGLPHKTIDPVFIGSQIVGALQGIVARNANPLDSLVISTTQFHAGTTNNVIPQTAELSGTVRTLRREMREFAETRLKETAENMARALGGKATVSYRRYYPVTFNHDKETAFAVKVARRVAGDRNVNDSIEPIMGAEDFSYMLEARPGAFIIIGNGDTEFCHHPAFDFNDEIIPLGISYWVALAESALAP
jgi:hippurate hydrolase